VFLRVFVLLRRNFLLFWQHFLTAETPESAEIHLVGWFINMRASLFFAYGSPARQRPSQDLQIHVRTGYQARPADRPHK